MYDKLKNLFEDFKGQVQKCVRIHLEDVDRLVSHKLTTQSLTSLVRQTTSTLAGEDGKNPR